MSQTLKLHLSAVMRMSVAVQSLERVHLVGTENRLRHIPVTPVQSRH